MKARRIALCVSLALLTLGLVACPSRKTIGEVTNNPGEYRDKEIALAGRVVRAYGALGQGVYEIEDGTGRIWVMSERAGAPPEGTYVGVSGRVLTGGVTLGNRTFGTVFRERERRTKDRL